ncbi:hypothetical protein CY35_15G052300 [Sphagnum magellanicum]|nr:hypothetical protein CY35_15G052300 [Sphagnum magellanicum]
MSYTCALGTFSRYTRYYSTQAPFQARYAQIHQQDEYPTQYVSLPCPESGMKQWSLSSAPPKGFPKVLVLMVHDVFLKNSFLRHRGHPPCLIYH